MKRLLTLLLVICVITKVRSQNITAAEYFFNADPGAGNGTPINIGSPGDIVNFNASISTASLGNGFHFLAIRVRDANGSWGLFEKRGFYISTSTTNTANIIAAEYFFDTDPGPGNGTPTGGSLNGATVNFTTIIPAAISAGFHFLAIRTRDADGKWSLFEKRGFYISTSTANTADIVAAEYFFDADPGAGNATATPVGASGPVVNFTVVIPTALSAGFHFLAIRTKDAGGKWGLFEKRGFYISTSTTNTTNIVAAEYFFDTDPGAGNGTATSVGTSGPTVNFTAVIPSSLSPGFHFLAIRTRDAEGKWSLFEKRGFYISTSTTDLPIITAAEFFIDSDPGVGNGTALIVTTPGSVVTQTFTVPVPGGLPGGDHLLSIRVRNQSGNWSLFEARTFTVGEGSLSITCPANKTVAAAQSQCSSVVSDIDPTVAPQGTAYDYTLSGATTGSGNGTASGQTFNVGITTVTYKITSSPAISCSFTVTINANVEVCNGIDDDCDGQVDEGVQTTFYQDADGDGFGNPSVTQQACSAPQGYVANNTDCNDNNAAINPNTIWYLDADNDNYYTGSGVTQCTSPGAGYKMSGLSGGSDCNDNNVAINPNTVWYLDADNDNYYTASGVTQCTSPGAGYKMSGLTGGGDCNDNNSSIHPGAIEVCNNTDDDCDGQTDEGAQPVNWYRDLDGDGYGNASVSQSSCTQPNGYILNNTDCNDNNINVHPGATEVCNGIDDDCDGQTDEGVTTTFYQDADGDGFGNQAVTQQACSVPDGYVANNTDCNDGNAAINPNTIWYLDADNDNYYTGTGVTQCASPGAGYKMSGLLGGSDCNDNNVSIHPGATEICNSVDDDCDGQIDEGLTTTFYQDADGDGYGNPAVTQLACSAPNGYVLNNTDCNDDNAAINPNTIWYLDADNDSYYTGSGVTQCTSPGAGYKISGFLAGSDCNDNNANIHPGATEICNNTDDDCDGQIDDGAQPVNWYQDADGDGFGNTAVSQSSCTQPNGYVLNNTDCNDNNTNVHPGATEVCNGIDDDCDGQTDEGVTTTYFQDADGDGFGNAAVTQQACSAPQGYVANNTDCNDGNAAINPNTIWYLDADNDNYYTGSGVAQCASPGAGYKMSGLTGGGDCNDNNANIHPGAVEICNNLDDDCDGQIDEGAQPVNWYQDLDGDGFGNPSVSQSSCTQPNGYVLNNTDCNDNNINVRPGATEICNNVDDDCDGQVDEGAQSTNWYHDQDGDGYGDPSVSQSSCTQPTGYVLNNTDCNDNNTNVHPGATEVCNNVDDDCDGQTDEGVTATFYRDNDGDGFGNPAVTQQACSAPQGYVSNSTDCNDNNINVHPGATEVCNSLDDDCDGQTDEGVTTTFYRDSDGDGFGNPVETQQACIAPQGYVSNSTDCNDNNLNVHLGATEVCGNSIDDDCDGQTDEGCQPNPDSDGDGYTVLQGDCNDNNAAIHPGAIEVCGNNIDDNCNGYTDENCLPGLPILSSRTYPVKEGDAGTTIFEAEVKLDRPAPVQLQLNYATANEDAIAGLDYVGTNGVLIIPAGGVSGMIRVGIIGDRLRESNERFHLTLSNPINVILGDAQSRIMILDDDKGKNNEKAGMENILTEVQPVFKIPNMVRRNNVWTIPGIERKHNEVMVVNTMGQLIFRASNYKNSVSIGDVATGIYFYQIKVIEKDNALKYYAGRLLITE